MISKSRLEELIEQGATIYSNDYGKIPLTEDNDLSIYENGQNNFILYALEPNKKYHYEIFDEDLFETEEDAEWYKEFGNITRTERLELPTWEEFRNYEEFTFIAKKSKIFRRERVMSKIEQEFIEIKKTLWENI